MQHGTLTPTREAALAVEADSGYLPRSIRADLDIPRNTRNKWHQEAKSLTRPVKNGYNDPLTHLLLIDALLRLTPNQMVRAANLRDLLRQRSPQLLWDSVTVGRILAELTEIAQGQAAPALTSARDRFGTYFTIDQAAPAYRWLTDLRTKLSEKVAEEIQYIAQGLEPPARAFSVWEGAA